jgi:beta-lactamase regulating signal transducer with metallopeptidase domain
MALNDAGSAGVRRAQAVQSVTVLENPERVKRRRRNSRDRFRAERSVIVVTVYLIGLAWLGFQAVLGWRFVRVLETRSWRSRTRRSSSGLETAQRSRRAPHAARAGRKVPILFSPVTMFVRRPGWSYPTTGVRGLSKQLDGVLAHELSHVARHDALTQRLALVYRAISGSVL